MAKDNIIQTPSSAGGLQRFTEEYNSKLQMSPEMVTIMIAAVIVVMTLVKIFIKIPTA